MLETAVSLPAEILALKEEKGWTWKEFAFHVNLMLGEKSPSETSLFRYAKGISAPTAEIEQVIFQAIRAIRNSQSVVEETAAPSETSDGRAQLSETAPEETGAAPVNEMDAAHAEQLAIQVAGLLTTYKEETGQTWVQIAAQVKSAFEGKAPSGSTLFRYSKSYTVPPVDVAQSLITTLARLRDSAPAQSQTSEAAPIAEVVATAEPQVPVIEEAPVSAGMTLQEPVTQLISAGDLAVAEEVMEPASAEGSVAVVESPTAPLNDLYDSVAVTPEDLEESDYWGPYNEFFELPEALYDEDFSTAVIAEVLAEQPEPVAAQAEIAAGVAEPAAEMTAPVVAEASEPITEPQLAQADVTTTPESAAITDEVVTAKPAPTARSQAIALADALMDLKRDSGWTWKEIASELERVMTGHVPSRAMLFQYARGLIEPEVELTQSMLSAIEKIQTDRQPPPSVAEASAAPQAEPVAKIVTAIEDPVVSEVAAGAVIEPAAEIFNEVAVVDLAQPMVSGSAEAVLEPVAEVAAESVAVDLAQLNTPSAAEAILEPVAQIVSTAEPQAPVIEEAPVSAEMALQEPTAQILAGDAVVAEEIAEQPGFDEIAPIASGAAQVLIEPETQLPDPFSEFAAIYEQWTASQAETPVAEIAIVPDQAPETLVASELTTAAPIADELVSPQLNGHSETAEDILQIVGEALEDPIIELIRNYKMALPALVEPRLPDLTQPVEFLEEGYGYRPEEDELVMFCRSREIYFSQVPGEVTRDLSC